MNKLTKILRLGLIIMIIMMGIMGCNNTNNSDIEFDLEQFETKIQEKGYEYQRQDLEDNFLAPISQYLHLKDNIIVDGKQYIFYDTEIVVYSYENNEEMENNASLINEDASVINKENPIELGYPKTPHFYKKGKIIVQYVGEDEKIITDLNEIMGEPFAKRDDLNDYKASIGTSVSDGGYTITINEALVNENELIVSSTIKSDNGPILGEMNFYPTILINNKELSYDSDESLERKDNSTINSISTYRFNENFIGDINVEIQYKPFNTSENSEVNKIEGIWNFAFDINADALRETSTVVEVDKAVTLDTGITTEFKEFKSNAFSTLIKTSVTGDISKFEVKLIGLDDLGNKYEFIVDKLFLDEHFNGTVVFALNTENSKMSIDATTLTFYPYLRDFDSNKDFTRIDEQISINLK